MDRAQTKEKDNVRITASVPSAEESKKIFGVNIYRRGIQPIWLRIENKSQEPVWFLPFSVDPGYYSPLEASFANHFSFSTPLNYEMNQYFFDRRQRFYISSESVRAGFVYSRVDEGTKEFNVDIFGEDNSVRTFTFFINVPGLRADHHQVRRLYHATSWSLLQPCFLSFGLTECLFKKMTQRSHQRIRVLPNRSGLQLGSLWAGKGKDGQDAGAVNLLLILLEK